MSELINKIHTLVDEGKLQGMTTCTIDNRNIKIDIYGNAIPGEPLTSESIYDIASMSKLFVATRVLQMIEDEVFELSTPVVELLPDFKNKEITIEHLLLHRSGFDPSLGGRYTMSKDEMIQSVLNCDDLTAPVDSRMLYSCINFILLGLVIESFDGSLDSSIYKHITSPLNMDSTRYLPTNKELCVPSGIDDEGNIIRGVVNDTTARRLGGIAGNAGIFSTVDDLIKFAEGYFQRTILTPETIQILISTNVDNRSLGWNIFQYKEKDYLYHTGYTGPSILLDIENMRGLILLTNRNYPKLNPDYVDIRLDLFRTFIDRK